MGKIRGTRLDLLILVHLRTLTPVRQIIEGFEDPKRWDEIEASLRRLEDSHYIRRYSVGKRDTVSRTALGDKVARKLLLD